MEEIEITRQQLDRQLRAAVAEDPLQALQAIGGVGRDLAARRGDAVRSAVQRHTWAEIGTALGVTKQAAHQRHAKEWAATLKDELKAAAGAYKAADRSGSAEEAATAKAHMEALIAELKNVDRRRR